MAQPMPESVKSVRVGVALPAAATPKSAKFEIKIGDDEVMILQAMEYSWYGTLQVGQNLVVAGLWRKSDEHPPGQIAENAGSPDMIWNRNEAISFVAESADAGRSGFVTFPRPLVLIRPPRLLLLTLTVTAVQYEARLYYALRRVSSDDLARLMVKDHA